MYQSAFVYPPFSFIFTLQIQQTKSQKTSLTLKRWTDGVEARPQGAAAAETQVRLWWPQRWMHSENTLLDLISTNKYLTLFKPESRSVLHGDPQSGWMISAAVALLQLNEFKGAAVDSVQLDQSIISVSTASKPQLPLEFGGRINGPHSLIYAWKCSYSAQK